jgi:hypothetical protein
MLESEQLPLIERRDIPFAQAVEEGAMALFGEIRRFCSCD